MSTPPKNALINEREKELLNRASYHSYIQTSQSESSAYCFRPLKEPEEGSLSPVIIFFHGGLFDQRNPEQFATQCLHFANRGMLAFTVEYRLSSIEDAMEDARSFLLFLQKNAALYGADMSKVVVAGCAGGGLLSSHLCSRHKKNGIVPEQIPLPAAQILYAPLINTTPKTGLASQLFISPSLAKTMSPSKQIQKAYPPTLAFHGKMDQVIPFEHSEKYFKALQKKNKKHVQLVDFETGRHIDFSMNVNPQIYESLLRSADHFLCELGIIDFDPDTFVGF